MSDRTEALLAEGGVQPARMLTMLRPAAGIFAALLCVGCASTPRADGVVPAAPILTQSSGVSHWPVEGETRPGIWLRFEAFDAPLPSRELIDSLRVVVDHGGRTQVITGAAFSPLDDASDSRQTRYLYTPTSGVMFATLQLRSGGRWLFPDTQRIELNDDCWHMLHYRVRGPVESDRPTPPPYPRTAFLSAALSSDPPLYLDVFLSGNCFRNPLPPS